MKKLLLLFFTFHFSLFILNAQGSWSQRASLPDSTRSLGVGFSIGKYGYVGIGTHNGNANYPCLDDIWQFNPFTNSWMQKANFPGKARISPATFVIGNYAYIVTGQTNDSASPAYTTECWQYNSLSDTWTQKANFPGSARAYDVGFAIGGRGYIGTGSQYYRDYFEDFWAYDTTTDSWTRIADMATTRFAASGFAVAGNGYVCFGEDSLKVYKDIWEYDTGTNSWTEKNGYSGLPIFAASGFVIGNSIYVGLAVNDSDKLSQLFWGYNTITDSWQQEADYPGAARAACSAFAVGDTGYLGLGSGVTASDYYNDWYKFTPDSTTGVDELLENYNISVFPNPFKNTCTVLLPGNLKSSNISFTLYNILGIKENLSLMNLGNSVIIDRNALPKGEYVLSIHFENITLNKKLIIKN